MPMISASDPLIPDFATSGINSPSVVTIPHNTHPMQTHANSGISKRKVFMETSLPSSSVEPTSFIAAFKLSLWRDVMAEEYDALIRQNTWVLAPLLAGKIAIGCKWLYRVKHHLVGSVARHKARLVTKGFHQEAVLTMKKPLAQLSIETHCSHYFLSCCTVWLVSPSIGC
ncbi:uncharacterized protein LOC111021626 [Momordica charantia]|uniref:Uncharacterized protein LOC111021626 n=1 Tax=Momordica charantia TaxID=3673 RepID=A0A6J1DK27_MOMCH|nr:uncharacterized protein LOC111021626 [Momordica charantia]